MDPDMALLGPIKALIHESGESVFRDCNRFKDFSENKSFDGIEGNCKEESFVKGEPFLHWSPQKCTDMLILLKSFNINIKLILINILSSPYIVSPTTQTLNSVCMKEASIEWVIYDRKKSTLKYYYQTTEYSCKTYSQQSYSSFGTVSL